MAEISNGYGGSRRNPRRNCGGKSTGGGRREGRSCSKGRKPGEMRNISQCCAEYFSIQKAYRGGEGGNREYKVWEARTSDTSYPCHHHR